MNELVHAAGGLVLLEPGDLIERTRARVAVLVFVQVIGPVLLLAAAGYARGARRPDISPFA